VVRLDLNSGRDPWHLLVGSTCLPLAILDRQFRYRLVSGTFADRLGFTQQGLIGRCHLTLFDSPEQREACELARDARTPTSVSARQFSEHSGVGTALGDLHWRCVPIAHAQPSGDYAVLLIGEPAGIASQDPGTTDGKRFWRRLTHHTDRLRQLLARRSSRLRQITARLTTLVEQAPIGISLVSRDGHMETANPAMTAICGYSAGELSGMSLEELLCPEDRGSTGRRLRNVLTGALAQSHLEQRFAHRDGRMIWVATTLSAIRTLDGIPTSAMLMVEDTTDERIAREALIESEKMSTMGRMAAALVHEINNPLQAVLGCLGLAEESLEHGEDAERYLQVAHEELSRTAEIVGRLRDMQRQIDPADTEPTDLGALVKNVLVLTESRCLDQRIQVVFKSPPCMPVVQAVPERLTQLFLNLVLNALDAMPKGGRLLVEMTDTSAPAGIRTTVCDTGEGMDPVILARPFEAFASTKASGLGLGLYISRKIVEEHGGQIRAASDPGQGTTLTVWLPATPGQSA